MSNILFFIHNMLASVLAFIEVILNRNVNKTFWEDFQAVKSELVNLYSISLKEEEVLTIKTEEEVFKEFSNISSDNLVSTNSEDCVNTKTVDSYFDDEDDNRDPLWLELIELANYTTIDPNEDPYYEHIYEDSDLVLSVNAKSQFFDPIYFLLNDVFGLNTLVNFSLTSYNFIFLPMVILFWIYFSLVKSASFVNFFNISMRQLVNVYRYKDILSLLIVKKFNLTFKLKIKKMYSLLLLNL